MKTSAAAAGALLLLWCLAGCQQLGDWGAAARIASSGEAARVGRVLSGQTVEIVRQADRRALTLRLLGVDAPDRRQEPWGDRARQYLETLTGQRAAIVELRDRDRYGRDLGYLWVDGKLVNARLVAAGHALAGDIPSEPERAQRLQRAQERARLLGLGIWDPQEPLREHPRTFRSRWRDSRDNSDNGGSPPAP